MSRYEQEFFQLLLVGRMLAPGGGFLQDGSSACPFSVIGSAKEPAELGNIKQIAEVFNKLIRRFVYSSHRCVMCSPGAIDTNTCKVRFGETVTILC